MIRIPRQEADNYIVPDVQTTNYFTRQLMLALHPTPTLSFTLKAE